MKIWFQDELERTPNFTNEQVANHLGSPMTAKHWKDQVLLALYWKTKGDPDHIIHYKNESFLKDCVRIQTHPMIEDIFSLGRNPERPSETHVVTQIRYGLQRAKKGLITSHSGGMWSLTEAGAAVAQKLQEKWDNGTFGKEATKKKEKEKPVDTSMDAIVAAAATPTQPVEVAPVATPAPPAPVAAPVQTPAPPAPAPAPAPPAPAPTIAAKTELVAAAVAQHREKVVVAPAPVASPVVEVQVDLPPHVEAYGDDPYLHAVAMADTPCFGGFVNRSATCKVCPLRVLCADKTLVDLAVFAEQFRANGKAPEVEPVVVESAPEAQNTPKRILKPLDFYRNTTLVGMEVEARCSLCSATIPVDDNCYWSTLGGDVGVHCETCQQAGMDQ